MKKLLIYVLIAVTSLLMLGCDKHVDWDLKYQEEDLLVVEGKISSEAIPHEVKLTRLLYEMNGSPEPVSGAVVEIFDGRVTYTLSEDSERPGIYRTDSLFAAELNHYYQLRIRHESKRITAVTFMREVSPFQYMNVFPVQADMKLQRNRHNGIRTVLMEYYFKSVVQGVLFIIDFEFTCSLFLRSASVIDYECCYKQKGKIFKLWSHIDLLEK